MVNIGISE